MNEIEPEIRVSQHGKGGAKYHLTQTLHLRVLLAKAPSFVPHDPLRYRQWNNIEKGAAAGEMSAWQKQEMQRKQRDAEAQSVALQPIKNHRAQRIKNKLSHCLNKAVRKE